MDWYVVHTKINKENVAESHLKRQNYIIYFPKCKTIIRNTKKISTVIKPLFPRYFFVRIDLCKQNWTSINYTYGVKNLLTMENSPVKVSESIIEKIKSQENPEGITDISFIDNFNKGDELNIHDGVFSGQKGFFLGWTDDNRVKILFNLLGKEITFSAKHVSLVS